MSKWRKCALFLSCALIALGLGLAAGQEEQHGFIEQTIRCENGSVLRVPVFCGLGDSMDSRANEAIAAACDLAGLIDHAQSGGEAGLHFRTYQQGRVYRLELYVSRDGATTQTVCHIDAATGRAYALADLFADPEAAQRVIDAIAQETLGNVPAQPPAFWTIEQNALVCGYAQGKVFVPLENLYPYLDLSGAFYRALLAKSLDGNAPYAL